MKDIDGENEFFEYNISHEIGYGEYQFDGCKLLRNVGDFAKGSIFQFIYIDYFDQTIEFPGKFKYRLKFEIGEKIESKDS